MVREPPHSIQSCSTSASTSVISLDECQLLMVLDRLQWLSESAMHYFDDSGSFPLLNCEYCALGGCFCHLKVAQ